MIPRILKVEPVALVGLGTAVQTLLVLLGVDKALLAAVGGLLIALIIVVRQMVSPLPHVVEAVANAAGDAASTTAQNLTEQTAGIAGEVTTTALDVVADATKGATRRSLKQLGVASPTH